MRAFPLGPEVALRMEALVGARIRPKSNRLRSSAESRDRRAETRSQSLAVRFAVAASIVILLGIGLLGSWMTDRIVTLAIGNAANASALYMESFFEPLAQSLATEKKLSKEEIAAIDAMLEAPALHERLLSLRIWSKDGIIAYAGKKERDLINTAGPQTPELLATLEGKVQVEYGLPDGDDLPVPASIGRLFEIYTPLHLSGSDRIIGIAEYYVTASSLEADLAKTRLWTWLMVGAVTLGMFSVLFAIVFKASRLIDFQRQTLEQRITDEVMLNEQNTLLRFRLQQANRRSSELNERYLRRVSSELHDGPAQHLALALLRLDELRPLVWREGGATVADPAKQPPQWTASALDIIKRALTEALREIRNISSGLALPELKNISPEETLNMAIRAHERATGTVVTRKFGPLPAQLPLSLKICLYRVAQEGLNNGFRHAGGKGQRVEARADEHAIEIDVIDEGPGFRLDQLEQETERLGLIGLRHRVRSLGGNLDVQSEIGRGTELNVRFPFNSVREPHV